jgi:hypothetical protein
MSDSYPYAKVTIIIEEGDKKQTIEIHKARNINILTAAIPVDEEIRKPWVYLQDSVRIGLDLFADFDTEQGNIMLETHTNAGKDLDG